ncbi:MAG: hypothetical protein M1607_00020 [Patescibacteria group bacterium]|nr:hypothetical protein [Patescibacteria group bacterium]
MKIIKIIFGLLSLLLLVYMLVPGPSSINDYPALPNAFQSTLSGDTWQVPNVKAYFSDNYRDFVVPFYQQAYQQDSWLPLPPFRLNYPPEFAYTAIKDQTQSTYLEELVYPLKGSLFVNGLEPLYEDGTPKYWGAIKFVEGGQEYATKVTLRYYPSPWWARMSVWLGINLAILGLWKVGCKIYKNG